MITQTTRQPRKKLTRKLVKMQAKKGKIHVPRKYASSEGVVYPVLRITFGGGVFWQTGEKYPQDWGTRQEHGADTIPIAEHTPAPEPAPPRGRGRPIPAR
jgi:hypothetical protein